MTRLVQLQFTAMNGIWGTIAVGLFATTSAPGNDNLVGLFYGGGFTLLGKQLIGMLQQWHAWTVVTITITFLDDQSYCRTCVLPRKRKL